MRMLEKNVLVTLLIIIFVIALAFILFLRKMSPSLDPSVTPITSDFLFKKVEAWGPCPPESEPCELTTIVYADGKVTAKGDLNYERQLTASEIALFKERIRKTGVFEKDCSGPTNIVDYMARVTVKLDGKQIEVKYPGCDDELEEIEAAIDLQRR